MKQRIKRIEKSLKARMRNPGRVVFTTDPAKAKAEAEAGAAVFIMSRPARA